MFSKWAKYPPGPLLDELSTGACTASTPDAQRVHACACNSAKLGDNVPWRLPPWCSVLFATTLWLARTALLDSMSGPTATPLLFWCVSVCVLGLCAVHAQRRRASCGWQLQPKLHRASLLCLRFCSQDVCTALGCGHTFHDYCLEAYASVHNKHYADLPCPSCRHVTSDRGAAASGVEVCVCRTNSAEQRGIGLSEVYRT